MQQPNTSTTTTSTTADEKEIDTAELLKEVKEMSPAKLATMMADAKGWTPEKDDEIRGIVLGVKRAFSDIKEDYYPIVFVWTTEKRCVGVHCFQTVLENEVKQQRPMPGEDIYIKCLGTDESKEVKKGYSPTIRYAVYVKRENTDNNPWEHFNS